mmetsp:Transcript_11189/g.21413  ORF Transcript_11189/g.21413 Transcript_11189/m.21413 type:complete len:272 (-) Transcript_11189:596-1411(-)
MIFRNDTFHSEPTVDTFLFHGFSQVECIAIVATGLEEWKFIVQIFRTSHVASPCGVHVPATNQAEIPVLFFGTYMCLVCLFQPVIVRHTNGFGNNIGSLQLCHTSLQILQGPLLFPDGRKSVAVLSSTTHTLPLGLMVQEMTIGIVFGTMHRILAEHLTHIPRDIPTFYRPSDRWVIDDHKRQFGITITQGLVVICFVIEYAQTLMNFVLRDFIHLRDGPRRQDFRCQFPFKGISRRRFVGTIVNVIHFRDGIRMFDGCHGVGFHPRIGRR